ncbi:response regulator [Stenotrophomonas sp. CFBP 13724]|nr:response regulator [Stenotrophomonas sp. CFBP 13724]
MWRGYSWRQCVTVTNVDNGGLAGKRILVAEDEYNIAMFLVEYLQMKDVDVVGPAGNLKALDALLDTQPVDGALLDINLGGELVYPLADRLRDGNIPFVLTSGYDDNVPERFAYAPRCGKPYRLEALTQALEQALQARHVPGSS